MGSTFASSDSGARRHLVGPRPTCRLSRDKTTCSICFRGELKEHVVDPAKFFHFAAQFEFYVFALTFVACICLMSLAAAWFIIATVLAHTFPNWRKCGPWLLEHRPKTFRLADRPKSSA